MENAEIPLRIETLQVASPDSAADRLTIQFQISTLCLEALTAAPSRAAATTQELR